VHKNSGKKLPRKEKRPLGTPKPQSFQANFGIMPRLGYNRFLPIPFPFINQWYLKKLDSRI
jgi:hypothetical protein